MLQQVGEEDSNPNSPHKKDQECHLVTRLFLYITNWLKWIINEFDLIAFVKLIRLLFIFNEFFYYYEYWNVINDTHTNYKAYKYNQHKKWPLPVYNKT